MKKVFAPGCAMMIYKPELADKVIAFLNSGEENVNMHLTCCRHKPNLEKGTIVVNTCAGCDKRYSSLYEGISTISLWEVLDASEDFDFPNYKGVKMTIHDACPTRKKDAVHDAIRNIIKKMNIDLVEPEKTKRKAVCCGDSFYGILPVDKVKEQMTKRADSMPCEDVAVYCVSCVKAMHIGGKRPRYLVDLLFGEQTQIGVFEPKEWHDELDKFINCH